MKLQPLIINIIFILQIVSSDQTSRPIERRFNNHIIRQKQNHQRSPFSDFWDWINSWNFGRSKATQKSEIEDRITFIQGDIT